MIEIISGENYSTPGVQMSDTYNKFFSLFDELTLVNSSCREYTCICAISEFEQTNIHLKLSKEIGKF